MQWRALGPGLKWRRALGPGSRMAACSRMAVGNGVRGNRGAEMMANGCFENLLSVSRELTGHEIFKTQAPNWRRTSITRISILTDGRCA
jgi:hypothetical protein